MTRGAAKFIFLRLFRRLELLSTGLDFVRPSSTVTVAPPKNAFHSRQLVGVLHQGRRLLPKKGALT